MSTMVATAPVRLERRAVRSPEPVGLRLTRRGRVVVTIVAGVLAGAVVLVSQDANAGEGGGAVPVETRTVVTGETLWEIAGEYAAPGEDVREVVDQIMDLNGLTGSGLLAGQELLVPRV